MQAEAAHVCYLTAGCLPLPNDNPACKLALLGGDHLAQRRTYASLLAIMRTEVYEFARCQGELGAACLQRGRRMGQGGDVGSS